METKDPLTISSQNFLEYLDAWMAELPELALAGAVLQPEHTALLSVDLINGFCNAGVLSSPRVKAIVDPVIRLMMAVWSAGVTHLLLMQDAHESDAVEFQMFAPHCVRGTAEAETIDEIKSLPFYNRMAVLEKNSIHSSLNTGLSDWLARNPELDTFIVVGDCTDLCTYQLATTLKLDANSRQLSRRVILPADCVQTYDLPVDAARQINTFPHDGNLLHAIFLYHMALNGIEVVQSIHA
jgi:nicotinamidase-related amidase